MDGEGFYYWPDGRIFEGTFVDGKKQGKGRFFWKNGQVYEGEFKMDECNGVGTLFYPDGKRFEGNWKEGNKHGKGTYVFPNGQLFVVIYHYGKKMGEGKFIDGAGSNIQNVKEEYHSLAKKAAKGNQWVQDIGKKLPKRPRGKTARVGGIDDGVGGPNEIDDILNHFKKN